MAPKRAVLDNQTALWAPEVCRTGHFTCIRGQDGGRTSQECQPDVVAKVACLLFCFGGFLEHLQQFGPEASETTFRGASESVPLLCESV